MNYIQTPKTITYAEAQNKKSLSPSDFKSLVLTNRRVKKISDLLEEKPQRGNEVGSLSYIEKSKFQFIRTKALQTSFFLPVLDDVECAPPILPTAFKNFTLKAEDILLSKDANIGEVAFLNEDLPNFTISGGLVRLRFFKNLRYYVFAFLKNEFFKSQINLMVSRGTTLKHAKKVWLDAIIPFPKQNQKNVIKFISLLIKAVIRKEVEIKKKFGAIIELTDEELNKNQKKTKFIFANPTLNEIKESMRLDAGMFCEEYKHGQFILDNYIFGTDDIYNLGFDFKRGQNLQVSQIGKSIYTDQYKPNFYKLIRPLNLSDYGTVEKYEYLGNQESLQILNRGEILFSAEGTIGRFCVFVDIDKKTITNIHGITIFKKDDKDDVDRIFLGLFLAYLRKKNILDYLSVGGQGGSLAEKYWKYVKICNFPRPKRIEMAKYYYNPVSYEKQRLTINYFENEDVNVTHKAGIWQLDKQIKQITIKLNEIVNKIIDDKNIEVDFKFLLR